MKNIYFEIICEDLENLNKTYTHFLYIDCISIDIAFTISYINSYFYLGKIIKDINGQDMRVKSIKFVEN